MKDWKNIKDKEIIIGLIIIIILGSIALFLLIKREVDYRKEMPMATEETYCENLEVEEVVQKEADRDSEVTETAEEETVAETSMEKEEIALANIQNITGEIGQKIPEEVKEEAALYDILGEEKYKEAILTERKQEDDQLKELYGYWDADKLDAVADLVRLERLQKVSKELEGTNKFYYYGSVDRLGRPSGKGLAVYEDNTYYFGEWKEGLRHGKGMWLQVAVYTDENKNKNLGVIEHSYNGQWSKDLPNGEGQEHFSYDYTMLKTDSVNKNECIANVIGGFKDGYYHGEMYVMSVKEDGRTKDWTGTCQNGVWEPIMKGNTTDAVWESYEKDDGGNVEYHYMYPQDNQNYGIIGLKK